MTDFSEWQAVFDLSLRYAEAIDRRRWDDLIEVFAPQVRVDFSSFSHAPASPDPVDGAAWVGVVRRTIDGFVSTQHLIANQRITFDSPNTARYTAYVQAQHWMDRERWYLVGGSYDNEAVCIDGRWRLSAITFNQTWDAGDRGLLREVSRRAGA
jgi:3-phenylpropionate/cinnamic acid dioxygenase small subunit